MCRTKKGKVLAALLSAMLLLGGCGCLASAESEDVQGLKPTVCVEKIYKDGAPVKNAKRRVFTLKQENSLIMKAYVDGVDKPILLKRPILFENTARYVHDIGSLYENKKEQTATAERSE